MKSSSIALLLIMGSIIEACADERTPEQLLPSTTQIYARWDGITAHQKAYDESARGKMFAGETGKAFDAIRDELRRKLKLDQAGEPLLNGQSPDEIRQTLASLKAAFGMPQLLAQTGLAAAFEIRPPVFDFATLRNLVGGANGKREQSLQPQFLITLIVPGGADKPELLALRMLAVSKGNAAERIVDGRKVLVIEEKSDNLSAIYWPEGKHFVLALGNLPVERIVAKFKNAGAGVTNHPLYKRVQDFKEFRVVTRGFADTANIVAAFEPLVKAYEPALWPILDATGIMGIKSMCFWDGFEADESRGVIEFDIPEPRRGFTKIFKPTPLATADLPPLPADLTRFVATRMDLGEIYDLTTALMGSLPDRGNDNGDRLAPEEQFRQRKETLRQEIDAAVGIKMADLFASLGDKVVTYQAPTDGILNIGQVIAISVKDEKTLRRCLDSLGRKITSAAQNKVVIKKRDCLGVDVREFVFQANSPVTISHAICDGWFVIGFQPQPVRGFIQRSRGKLPTWKPDVRTAATLAKVPADRGVIQVADPRASLQWIYGLAPVVGSLVGGNGNGNGLTLEAGLFPHAGEASQQLFPNVMWCRDNGHTMRWESRDSLWLPLEFIGPEMGGLFLGAGGLFFLRF